MSFRCYPKYRRSGVEWLGLLPEHWTISRLGFECDTLVPMRDKPADLNGEIPWIRIEDLEGKFISGSRSGQGVSPETVDAMNLKVLPRGTVLCSCSCSMGATAIVAEPLVTNQTFIGIVPKDGFSSDYLYFLFQAASEHLNATGTGAIQTYLSRDDFRRLRIPKPPMVEQVILAAFLDRETAKIDALVAEQERLIELLKEKRQVVIAHAVTKGLNPDAPMKPSGIEWIGEVPAHWDLVAFRRLIIRIEQGWSPNCESFPAAEGEWGVLKVGCVNDDTFDPGEQKALPAEVEPVEDYAVSEGDLLMSRGNTADLVGMASVVGSVTHRLLLSDLLYRIRLDASRAVPDFVVLLLRSAIGRYQIQRLATGTSASMKKISQGDIRELYVLAPPLDEQRKIAAFAHQLRHTTDSLTREADAAIQLLQERRVALISAAVTGQIDVRLTADTEVA